MPSTRQPAGDVLDAGLHDPKISIVVGLLNQAVSVGMSVSAAAHGSWVKMLLQIKRSRRKTTEGFPWKKRAEAI